MQWRQFWADQGLTQQEVGYSKGLGDGTLEVVEEMVNGPKTRVVGLVVDKVDKIKHGMQLGTAGMHNQVRQWAGQPFMAKPLRSASGERIPRLSDFRPWEYPGCGLWPSRRGGRCRPARRACSSLPRSTAAWSGQRAIFRSHGVATNRTTRGLFASTRFLDARRSWARTNRVVGHGGASLEELVVPFVQIESRDT